MQSFDARASASSRAFSLVELLTVMAIIAVLLGLVIPASTGIGQGFNVTSAGQTVADQFTLARQTALEQNRSAEIRFYYLKSSASGSQIFRGMQVWKQVSNQGTPGYLAVSRVVYLPNGFKLLQDVGSTAYSPLVNADTFASYKNTDNLPAGAAAGSYYMAVRFRGTGNPEATLTPTTNYVTVASERETGGATPKNFYTVQIDPLTGRTLGYRP